MIRLVTVLPGPPSWQLADQNRLETIYGCLGTFAADKYLEQRRAGLNPIDAHAAALSAHCRQKRSQ